MTQVIKPDLMLVTKAVLSTEAMGMGLTEKQQVKYVADNCKARLRHVVGTYQPWADVLGQEINYTDL